VNKDREKRINNLERGALRELDPPLRELEEQLLLSLPSGWLTWSSGAPVCFSRLWE